jgi:hypothetical protein
MKTLVQNLSQGKYCLDSITIKEICNKYPDKIMDITMNKNKIIYLVMDTCTIIFNSNFLKQSSSKRIDKQIRNNKNN